MIALETLTLPAHRSSDDTGVSRSVGPDTGVRRTPTTGRSSGALTTASAAIQWSSAN